MLIIQKINDNGEISQFRHNTTDDGLAFYMANKYFGSGLYWVDHENFGKGWEISIHPIYEGRYSVYDRGGFEVEGIYLLYWC